MDLISVAGELYGLPPDQFTSGRDARAAEAKSAGDRDLANSIKKLRRPTNSAWLANLLTRSRAREIAQLLDLGTAMRQAQNNLAADEMRGLSEQRRKLVTALAAEAKKLAADLGQRTNDSTIEELEATLEAALADPEASESLRSGRLTVALRYSGFGPVDLTDAVAAPAKPKSSKVPPSRGQRQDQKSRAKEALAEAEADSVAKERLLQTEVRRLEKAIRERDRLFRQVADLEARIQALREAADRAERACREAQKAHDVAKRAADKTKALVERERKALDLS
jgi:hypothetical protein